MNRQVIDWFFLKIGYLDSGFRRTRSLIISCNREFLDQVHQRHQVKNNFESTSSIFHNDSTHQEIIIPFTHNISCNPQNEVCRTQLSTSLVQITNYTQCKRELWCAIKFFENFQLLIIRLGWTRVPSPCLLQLCGSMVCLIFPQ